MEIIVEGHKIDTKDIYDIESMCTGRFAGFKIKLTEKDDIVIGRRIPYERTPNEIMDYHKPYNKLMESIKEKWESDKTEIPIFKL